MPGPLSHHWTLDPRVDYLNHGSFGACPAVVLDAQERLRRELEREPVDFLVRKLPALLDGAREALAAFVGADPEGLVPVPNATTGVNTALRSYDLSDGDDVVVTDHAYSACRNALNDVAGGSGASVTVARVPFPVSSPEQVAEAVLEAVSSKTRIVLLDHVTSPTGLIFPVESIVRDLLVRGVDCLVNGAHAPGMLPVAVGDLGCAFYTGNCHKWLCAPKGAGFLWVREDKRARVRPLVISHGASVAAVGRSRFHAEFDWLGTTDPTAFLCVPAALQFVGGLLEGGWPAVRAHNHRLAVEARAILGEALGVAAPCPDGMLGSLASVPLPPSEAGADPLPGTLDPLQEALRFRHAIEVPIVRWPGSGGRLIRIAAQLYNSREQYARLAGALTEELARSETFRATRRNHPRGRGGSEEDKE